MKNDKYTALYWFWSKTQLKNKKGETSPRTERLFSLVTKNFLYNMKQQSQYNGQSKREYEKNFSRIEDIIEKTTDADKQISLAQTQATRIFDEYKALNRAFAAKEMGHEHLFEVFFRRAYELGSVGKQQYREYQLSKLGI
jgi:hypothetical protein